MSEENTKMSPLIYIGLLVFVVPTMLNIFRIGVWPIVGEVGLAMLLIGIIHTAYMRMRIKK